MVTEYFRSARVRKRLARSELGGVFEDVVGHMDHVGYCASTVQQYVQAIEHFDRWLRRAHVRTSDIVPTDVERFLRKHLPRCRCRSLRCRSLYQSRAALSLLLVVLRKTGRIKIDVKPDTPTDSVIAGFVQHLLDRRGMAPSTAEGRARYVREFLKNEFGDGPIKIGRLGLSTVTEFLVAQRGRWCAATMKAAASALRSYFRYLALEQDRGTRLAASVPTIAGWKLTAVPRVLEEREVRTILSSFDRRTPIGRRQFASTMCLAFLGLRTREVSALTIDDIDWRAGTIRIAATKSRRSDVLPLPEAVARAILDYLRSGRPKTASRQIFVRHAPAGSPGGTEIVRSAVRIACARTKLDPHIGPRAFRHTVATRLLRRGASMKEIADVLRHRNIDTSAIYAKVDLPALTEVAAKWPGRSR